MTSGGFSVDGFSYRLDTETGVQRFSMTIASADRAAAARLAKTLERTDFVQEFRISPSGS